MFSIIKYFMFVKNFRSCYKHGSTSWATFKNSIRRLNREYRKLNSLFSSRRTHTPWRTWGDFRKSIIQSGNRMDRCHIRNDVKYFM
jgi:hypothetical protein